MMRISSFKNCMSHYFQIEKLSIADEIIIDTRSKTI